MPDEEITIDRKLLAEINKRYSPFPTDDWEKTADGLYRLISSGGKQDINIPTYLNEVARTIYRLFEFNEVGIVVKDKKDKLFRYVTLLGYRKEAETAHRKLVYSDDDFKDEDRYPHAKMGRSSEFHFAEYVYQEGEDIEKTYNRPIELSVERKSPDDFLEGDYIDVDIKNINNVLLGWIELSKPRSRKLPPRSTIIWVELLASFLSIIIQREFDKTQ